MTTALVEGFAPDAVALARFLAAEGATVRIAGPGPAPPEAAALRDLGVVVDTGTDLDEDTEAPDVAYLDVWTLELAPRVRRLRAAGTRLTCLADLVLERSPAPTLGVTGTAGKSTTTAFAVQLLRHAGLTVAASTTARAGNLWPTEEHVALLADPRVPPHPDVVALELTSSHLAFCTASPTVAVVTCFHPDHLELHGSLAAYRAAKERIVADQCPDDRVVVNADDHVAASFAALTPARASAFSTTREVGIGAFLHRGSIVARTATAEADLGPAPGPAGGRDLAALAAVAAALACGVDPASLTGAPARLGALPHRARTVARRGGIALVDDGMAATPVKTAATLATYPPGTVVAVVGGALEVDGHAVHASPEERALLGAALETLAHSARLVVLFGPAGAALESELRRLGARTTCTDDLAAAIEWALAAADDQTAAVVVSPMFPIDLAERQSVAGLLTAGA